MVPSEIGSRERTQTKRVIRGCQASQIGFGKRGLFRKSFQKVHVLEIVENLEILESPQTVENRGESESLELLEILKIPPVKRPLC